MSMPAGFDVRTLTYDEYRVLRIHAAIEAIYADQPGRERALQGRMSCREAVRRYEAFRRGVAA